MSSKNYLVPRLGHIPINAPISGMSHLAYQGHMLEKGGEFAIIWNLCRGVATLVQIVPIHSNGIHILFR